MGKKIFRSLILTISVGLAVFFLYLTFVYFDLTLIIEQVKALLANPVMILLITVSYFLAFVSRGIAWRLYVQPNTSFRYYLGALFYSLFFNHILPIKAGDVIRACVLARHKNITIDQSLHSVFIMRVLDIGVLGFYSMIGALILGVSLPFPQFFMLMAGFLLTSTIIIFFVKRWKHPFVEKHLSLLENALFTKKGSAILFFVLLSWVLEAIVIFGIILSLDESIGLIAAVWINSLTVVSSIFHFTPGGIGTYESVMSFSLAQLDIDWSKAYSIALITHGYKFLFSYAAGIIAFLLVPTSWSTFRQWIQKKGATQ
jgi:uncharacterized membrane protein YbhN (UPF0104 family)